MEKFKNYQIISIIFTFIFGTLLHFTYNLSDNNMLVAIFSSINESVWEHLKLLYFPMLFATIIGYFYIGKNIKGFICSKTIGIISAMIFIVVFFYTYTGILGKDIAVIDISSFFIATLFGEYIAYILVKNDFMCNSKIAVVLLISIFVCFAVFSFYTPKLGIFKEPNLNKKTLAALHAEPPTTLEGFRRRSSTCIPLRTVLPE